MVSSKFARSKHAFRVPDVCKSKKQAKAAQYPPDTVNFWYDVDVTYLSEHYVFSGTNTLNIEDSAFGYFWRWFDTPSPPEDGAWSFFQHNFLNGDWWASLTYYVGGSAKLVGNASGIIDLEPPVIHTGRFQLDFGSIWQGKRDGQVDS